ncbi:serine hydrolase domain-containing protein [Dactylosporangium sp. NPDC005555]|uniref:serine hydrolase domain-containing protein n=1 Tax=Dactylosporangium sp. NPDC005555 TaxID=3154889 RepID=UPI0033A11885
MRALSAALIAAAIVAGPALTPATAANAGEPRRERCAAVAAGTPLHGAVDGLPDAEASGALLLLHDAQGCRQGTAGIADVHSGRTVPIDGRFRIGSMTKTFTAVVALQLAAEHRLDLDQTVQHYLPGLLPVGTAPVTVRQVLTYTSGINHVEVPNKQTDWFLAHRYDRWAKGSQIDTAKPLAFTPGTKQRYGNVDYIVAGLLIEKVTGRTWESQIQRRIVDRLGLRGTTAPGRDVEVRGPHAHGYEATAAGWVDVTRADMSLQWSAASVISTAPDLDRFMVALFSGRLVPQPQLEEMFTVPAGVKLFDGNDDPGDDRDAVYSAGLTKLPVGPLTLWGKSGDRPGYNNGMAATRDLSSRLVFSVNTLHMGGSEQPVRSQRIIAAALLGL